MSQCDQPIDSVNAYIAANPQHADALTRLRDAVNRAPLEETIKWGAPCYTLDGKNIVGLAAFKSYVGLWFHQGALLSDPQGVLVDASAGKTKALRQWRFGSPREIKVRLIRAYLQEAIDNAEQGRAIKPTKKSTIATPPELADQLGADARLRAAFAALTPGRQSEYAAYITEAKRPATKQSRLDKVIPMIKAGAGLHDKYRKS